MGNILVITGFCKTMARKWSCFLNRLSTISNKYKKASFYGWGSTASRLQPLQATASPGMQFTFCQSSPRNSWYSFYRPWKDERLSQPFQHGIPGLGTQQISHQAIAPCRQDILVIIHSLNINKAYGYDDNSIRLLKICDSSIVKPLSKLVFS